MSRERVEDGNNGDDGIEYELTDVDRIGERVASELRDAGVETVEQLAGAEALAEYDSVFDAEATLPFESVESLVVKAARLVYDDSVASSLQSWFDALDALDELASVHETAELMRLGAMDDDELEEVSESLAVAASQFSNVMMRVEREHGDKFVFMEMLDDSNEQGESRD